MQAPTAEYYNDPTTSDIVVVVAGGKFHLHRGIIRLFSRLLRALIDQYPDETVLEIPWTSRYAQPTSASASAPGSTPDSAATSQSNIAPIAPDGAPASEPYTECPARNGAAAVFQLMYSGCTTMVFDEVAIEFAHYIDTDILNKLTRLTPTATSVCAAIQAGYDLDSIALVNAGLAKITNMIVNTVPPPADLRAPHTYRQRLIYDITWSNEATTSRNLVVLFLTLIWYEPEYSLKDLVRDLGVYKFGEMPNLYQKYILQLPIFDGFAELGCLISQISPPLYATKQHTDVYSTRMGVNDVRVRRPSIKSTVLEELGID